MCAAAKSWPSLDTTAIFSDASGAVWVAGDDLGDHWVIDLDARSVRGAPFSVTDAWTSAHGATYLATKFGRGIVRAEPPSFSSVYLGLPSRASIDTIELLAGRSREAGQDDDLYLVASRDDESQIFAQRRAGVWSELALRGTTAAMAISPAGEILLAHKALPRRPHRRRDRSSPVAGSLLRVKGRSKEVVRLPKEAGSMAAPIGLQWLDEEECLVLLAPGWKAASAWIMNRAGRFRRIEPTGRSPSLAPWVGRIRCREWRGEVYLPTTNGVFVLDAGRKLRRASSFKSVSLWPVEGALICRGWRNGAVAHEILRARDRRADEEWEDFHVPEPGVVSGARGAFVWLGRGRKVPVIKLRLPAAKAPTPVAVVKTTGSRRTNAQGGGATRANAKTRTSPAFTLRRFLEELAVAKGSKPRKPSLQVARPLERAYGAKAAPDLSRHLELLGSHTLGAVGLWRVWNPPDLFVPPLGTDRRGVLAVYEEPVLTIAALTGAVAIGADGGGQQYFAEHGPKRSDVFIHGPGVGELKFLAESFTSFAELNDVLERWTRIASERGWEDEDLLDGDLDTRDPDFVLARGLARALRGKVNLPGFVKSDMASDFDELVPKLAGEKLRLTTDSDVPKLYERADWLIALFSRGSFYRDAADRVDRSRRHSDPYAHHAASRLYWLWHHFFFDNTDALDAALTRGAGDRSTLVQETAGLLVRLAASKTLPPKLERFRALREVVRAAGRG